MAYQFNQNVYNQQLALNKQGAGLKADGFLGPLTQAAITKYGGGTSSTPQGTYMGQTGSQIATQGFKSPTVGTYQGGQSSPIGGQLGAIQTGDQSSSTQNTSSTPDYESQYKALLNTEPPTVDTSAFDTANTRLANIQNEEDKRSLKGAHDIQAQLDASGMLRSGAQETAQMTSRRTNAELADLAVQEGAAGRTAQVAQTSLAQRLADAQQKRQASLDAVKFGLERQDKALSRQDSLKADALAQTNLDRKFAEDKRQFGLDYALKQRELNISQQKANYDTGAGENSNSYNGDFSSTIDQVANMESTVAGKKNVSTQLKNLIANKGYKSAYNQIANSVEQGLVGESKQRYANARTDYQVMNGLQKAVQDYTNAGGNTSLLTGTAEQIKRKLGIDSGKESALATQLWREFQTYRNTMTGAAFGAAESRDYASVNPTLGKSLNLNLSVINGAMNQLKNRVEGTINSRVPSAQYILEYANGANASSGGAQTSGNDYQSYLNAIGIH